MRKRVLGAQVALFLSAVSLPRAAHADEPPPTGGANLVPPEAQHRPPPSVEPSNQSSGPVEVLPTKHPQRVAAYIFAGTAVAGIAVGAAFGALALTNTNSWNSSNQTSPAAASYRGLANQDSVASDVGFGVAVIAGVTSVVLFLKPEEPPPPVSAPPSGAPPVSFSVAPILTAHTAGAGALVRF
jgi:hypothetical protein